MLNTDHIYSIFTSCCQLIMSNNDMRYQQVWRHPIHKKTSGQVPESQKKKQKNANALEFMTVFFVCDASKTTRTVWRQKMVRFFIRIISQQRTFCLYRGRHHDSKYMYIYNCGGNKTPCKLLNTTSIMLHI